MNHVAARTTTRPAAVYAAAALLGFSSLALAQSTPAPAAAQHQKKAESPAKIKSEGSYSLGLSVGESLRRMSVDANAISTQRLMQGLHDALTGKVTFGAENQQYIRTLLVGARARIGNENHAAAHAFLASNGKKKGVVTTQSGLEYEVLKAGQGSGPKPGDTVTVNYRGTLLDGKEFDSSFKRGQPATFPVDRVIPGWQEALKLMKPGAKWRIFVPPQLAYDLNPPMGAPIPPGSMLIFDVDLLGIQPPQPAQPLQPQSPPPPAQPHP